MIQHAIVDNAAWLWLYKVVSCLELIGIFICQVCSAFIMEQWNVCWSMRCLLVLGHLTARVTQCKVLSLWRNTYAAIVMSIASDPKSISCVRALCARCIIKLNACTCIITFEFDSIPFEYFIIHLPTSFNVTLEHRTCFFLTINEKVIACVVCRLQAASAFHYYFAWPTILYCSIFECVRAIYLGSTKVNITWCPFCTISALIWTVSAHRSNTFIFTANIRFATYWAAIIALGLNQHQAVAYHVQPKFLYT